MPAGRHHPKPAHPGDLSDVQRPAQRFCEVAGGFYPGVVYNQRDYPKIPYPAPGYEGATVKTSGCGPTCAAMVVETLTDMAFPPPEAVKYAVTCGARVSGGTDMGRLSRCIAEEFGLEVCTTNDTDELLAHLKQNGVAVANVGGDRAGYKGVFSDGGHYVVVMGIAPDGRLIIADPGLYSGKYDKSHRGVVEVVDKLLYAAPAVLDKDAGNRNPQYTLLGCRESYDHE